MNSKIKRIIDFSTAFGPSGMEDEVSKLAMEDVKDICEVHILEDFGMRFIPTAQDYLEHMDFQDWMQNGIKDCPSSFKKLKEKGNIKKTMLD